MNNVISKPELDELDKRILEQFPHASDAIRASIRERTLKRHAKLIKHEQDTAGSILTKIETAPNIEGVGLMRTVILYGINTGRMEPQSKILRKWEAALWTRVLNLMLATRRPQDCCYIYNFTYLWSKPPATADLLRANMELHCLRLPNHAQQLLAQGIEIEGHTKLPTQ